MPGSAVAIVGRKGFEFFAKMVESLQLVDAGSLTRNGADGSNFVDRLFHVAFQEEVSEERSQKAESEDEGNADDRGERDAAQQADARTEGTGAERDAVFQNHFIEKLRKENPIGNFTRAGRPGSRNRLRSAHVGSEDYCGVAVEGGLGSLHLVHRAYIFDDGGTDSGKIKSA